MNSLSQAYNSPQCTLSQLVFGSLGDLFISLNSMFKKSTVVVSSYSSWHSLYCPQSISINTASNPRNPPHSKIPPKQEQPRRRYHATARSKSSPRGHEDDFPWPELPFATAVPTPYQILYIKRGDPYSKRRFYELAKIYHPDRNGHENNHANTRSLSGAVKMERYRMVVAAHEILSDPAKRNAYDVSGAGWNGRPEHGAPKYDWGQNSETRWSGFDTNDSPFQNATWEDWEKWYQRDKAKQEPVYFSNGSFLMLVATAVFLGGFGQSIRVGDYSSIFQRQVEMVHDDASKGLRRRKADSTEFGNKDERLDNFLKSRDPRGYGITDPTEETYRKMLPEPEVCMSDGIHQQNPQRTPEETTHDSSARH